MPQLRPGESPGLDTLCEGVLSDEALRARRSRHAATRSPGRAMNQALAAIEGRSAELLVAFFVSIAVSVLLGAVMRRVSAAIGAVVPPRPDRWHSSPTPTMGGVAIALATLAGLALTVFGVDSLGGSWVPVLLAALAMFAVGVMDDRLQLSPLAKLVASLAIGAFLVFVMAGAEPAGSIPLSSTLIATVWFAGICHALNLLDNMDGLAAGVALIATLFLAFLLGKSLGPGLVLLLDRARGRARGLPVLEPAAGAALHG